MPLATPQPRDHHRTQQADPRQDPRADPKDHIIRTHGVDAAGDLVFCRLNLALWAADAALFRPYWEPGAPGKLPNVQLLLGMVRGGSGGGGGQRAGDGGRRRGGAKHCLLRPTDAQSKWEAKHQLATRKPHAGPREGAAPVLLEAADVRAVWLGVFAGVVVCATLHCNVTGCKPVKPTPTCPSTPLPHSRTDSGAGIFPPATAAFVAVFNFAGTTAKLWLAARAGGRVAPERMRMILPVAGLLFALGGCRGGRGGMLDAAG
jgi:hypothetical protein